MMRKSNKILFKSNQSVGNIILNSVLASFGNSIETGLQYSVPVFSEKNIERVVLDDIFKKVGKTDSVFLCEVNFSAKEIQVDGQVVLFFGSESITKLFTKFDVAS